MPGAFAAAHLLLAFAFYRSFGFELCRHLNRLEVADLRAKKRIDQNIELVCVEVLLGYLPEVLAGAAVDLLAVVIEHEVRADVESVDGDHHVDNQGHDAPEHCFELCLPFEVHLHLVTKAVDAANQVSKQDLLHLCFQFKN